MQYEQMVESVQQHIAVSRQQAEAVLSATVQALSETTHAETQNLQAQLPEELKHITPAGKDPDRSLDEFLVRVSDLEGLADPDQAREHTQAGFRVLAEATSSGQLRDFLEDLPAALRELAPPQVGLSGSDEILLAEVRKRTGLDSLEQARELTQVVLAVMAEHITRGQAQDLAAQLPEDAGAVLQATQPAQHTEAERFFDEISERASVTNPDLVRTHTAGVFAVLHQWAPHELAASVSQLPKPIAELAA